MAMLFTRNLLTGNEIVDTQHREIFRLVQCVLDADTDRGEKIETALTFLANYVSEHFAAEEKLMAEVDYPNAAEHAQQHVDFMEAVGEFAKRFEAEGKTISVSQTINNLVLTWLDEHIKNSDMSLADYCRKKNEV